MPDSQVDILIKTQGDASGSKAVGEQLDRDKQTARELASELNKVAAAEGAVNSARAKGASSAAGSTTPPAGKKMLEVEAPQFNATTRMMMLEHSIRSITDASAAGISPMRALAMEAGRLGPAFGIGLGGTLAIAGISTVVTEFSRAREEAKALKAEVHEALHFENPDFHTQDELQAKLGMTKKAYDDLVKSSQTSTLGDTARMPVAGAQSLATKLWVAFSPDTYMGHADRSKKMAGEFLGE